MGSIYEMAALSRESCPGILRRKSWFRASVFLQALKGKRFRWKIVGVERYVIWRTETTMNLPKLKSDDIYIQ
jgi:hypothetical protein